jgi:hypothetical protein
VLRDGRQLHQGGALGLAQAVADAAFGERQHERPHGSVVELAQDRVCAGADLFGGLGSAELVGEQCSGMTEEVNRRKR